MKIKVTSYGKFLKFLFFAFFILSSFHISARQLRWKAVPPNNQGQLLANYDDLLTMTTATGSLNVQATDTVIFQLVSSLQSLTFTNGFVARVVILNAATAYTLNFQGTNGGTIVDLNSTGTAGHIITGKLSIYGSVSLNGATNFNNLDFTCLGTASGSHSLNFGTTIQRFNSGVITFNSNSTSSYNLVHDLNIGTVRMVFLMGNFNTNGFAITSQYNTVPLSSENEALASIAILNQEQPANLNFSNSKIILNGNIHIRAYQNTNSSLNFSGSEITLNSANLITTQAQAGFIPLGSQRYQISNISKLKFLSDAGGNNAFMVLDGRYYSYITADSTFIDHANFEFRGSGKDLPAAAQNYFNTNVLSLTSQVSRVGYSSYTNPIRIGTLVVPPTASCNENLLFESLTPNGGTGALQLTNSVIIPHLSVHRMRETGPGVLTAGYDLSGNVSIGFTPSITQDFYWVGGAGNWNNADHWSIGPGGTFPTSGNTNPGSCLPTISDNVFFTTTSGLTAASVVAISDDSTSYCKNMTWEPACNGVFTSTGTGKLFISGNLDVSGATGPIGVLMKFVLGGNRTIISGGKSFTKNWLFVHTGTYTLQDDLAMSTADWMHYSGTFNTNAQTVDLRNYIHPYDGYWDFYPSNTFLARSLIMTNSKVNIYAAATPWDVWANSFTLQAIGSELNFLATNQAITFRIQGSGATQNYWDVNIVNNVTQLTTFNSSINVSFNDMHFEGNTSFTDGTINTTWAAHNLEYAKSYTYNFNQIDFFNLTGTIIVLPQPTCGGITFMTAHPSLTFKINASIAQNLEDMMFTNIDASLGQTFTITNGVNNGGNVNVNFVLGLAKIFYWRGGNLTNLPRTNNWDDGVNWAINSNTDFYPSLPTGSNPNLCIPSPADSVVFDNESFHAVGQQVLINTTAYCKDIVWTPTSVTFSPTFNFNTGKILAVYRSLRFQNGMAFSGMGSNSRITFNAMSGTNGTIEFAGPLSFPGDLQINGFGNYDIISDLAYRYFFHQNGNLNTNGFYLRGFGFGSFGEALSGIPAAIRTLDFANSTVELTGGLKIFHMDYRGLTSLDADSVFVQANGGAFKNIGMNAATIYPIFGHVRHAVLVDNHATSSHYFYGGLSLDLRGIINAHPIYIKKLEYDAAATLTRTYGSFTMDTLILAKNNRFYDGSNYIINDTVITNGVTCRTTVIQGAMKYDNNVGSVELQIAGNYSNFISPTCDLKLQSVNMSNVRGVITSCITPTYEFSGIDGLGNLNWIFDPVNSSAASIDTMNVSCTSYPLTITVPSTFAGGATSYLWNTGSSNDTIFVNAPGIYSVIVNYGGGCILYDTTMVIQTDTIAPVIVNCLNDTTLFAGITSCDALIPDFTSSMIDVTDNCGTIAGGGITITQFPIAGTLVLDTTTIWMYATDAAGNVDSCSFEVTLVDTVAPVFDISSLPTDTTVNCNSIPLPTVADITASDNCTPTLDIDFTVSETSTQGLGGSCSSNSYVITRVYTASDLAGNIVTYSQIINVQDTIAPIFDILTLPNDTTVNCDNIPNAVLTGLIATDNCALISDLIFSVNESSTQGAPGTCANSNYVITRTFFVEDSCGNSSSHIQTITVQDTTAPIFNTILLGDTTVNCDVVPLPTTSGFGAMDNCTASSDITISTLEASNQGIAGTCEASNYTITRTYTAIDLCGNVQTHEQIITVQDTTAPVFIGTLPVIVTVNCDDISSVDSLAATDNCSAMVNVVFSETSQSGICANNYIINRTWTATDVCGNIASHEQIIIVQDTVGPIIVDCPTNIIQNNDLDMCGAIVTWTVPSATDNCSSAVTITSSHQPNTFFSVGTTPVQYIIIDECGNVSTCSFEVVVNDVQNPNVSVIIAESFCANEFVTWQEQISDNCAIQSVVSSHVNGSVFEEGTIAVSITATDIHGNESTYTFEVVVAASTALAEISTTTTTVCAGSGFTLTALNSSTNNTYTWYFNGNVVGIGVNYVVESAVVNQSGVYTLEVTNAEGCGVDTTISIEVKLCDIVISETFSPNFDGQNDYFYIENLEAFPNTKVTIYNRWGTEVFHSDNYQNDWDGTSQSKYNVGGDLLPEGSYFYLLELGGTEGDSMFGKIYKGYVYLKR